MTVIVFVILLSIIAPLLLGYQFHGFFNFLIREIVATMPDNLPSPYSWKAIKDKTVLVGGLFLISMNFGLLPLLVHFVTRGKMKSKYFGSAVSLFLGASAIPLAYHEYKGGTATTVLHLVLFAAVFLLSIYAIIKAKSFLKRGFYVVLVSATGFYLRGYGLITPYIMMLLCGYTMMFIIKGKPKRK